MLDIENLLDLIIRSHHLIGSKSRIIKPFVFYITNHGVEEIIDLGMQEYCASLIQIYNKFFFSFNK